MRKLCKLVADEYIRTLEQNFPESLLRWKGAGPVSCRHTPLLFPADVPVSDHSSLGPPHQEPPCFAVEAASLLVEQVLGKQNTDFILPSTFDRQQQKQFSGPLNGSEINYAVISDHAADTKKPREAEGDSTSPSRGKVKRN